MIGPRWQARANTHRMSVCFGLLDVMRRRLHDLTLVKHKDDLSENNMLPFGESKATN